MWCQSFQCQNTVAAVTGQRRRWYVVAKVTWKKSHKSRHEFIMRLIQLNVWPYYTGLQHLVFFVNYAKESTMSKVTRYFTRLSKPDNRDAVSVHWSTDNGRYEPPPSSSVSTDMKIEHICYAPFIENSRVMSACRSNESRHEIINQVTSTREPEWVLLGVCVWETCSDDISKYLWC